MVRVFDHEVQWRLPVRSTSAASALKELQPATEKYEAWRYSSIDDLSIRAFSAPALEGVDRESLVRVVRSAGFRGDGIVDVGPHGVRVVEGCGATTLVREVAAAGELVEVPEEPYATLASVFAPTRVELAVGEAENLALLVGSTGAGAAGFAWIRVRFDGSGTLWLVDGAGDAALQSSVVEIEVAPRVRASVRHLPSSGVGSVAFLQFGGSLEEGSRLEVVEVAAGSGYYRTRTDVALRGEGASLTIRSAFVVGSSELKEFRTFVAHRARQTRSDLLYKGAVCGSGASVYSGLITITPEGHGSDAFQTNRNLLLSPSARAESVPNLDIQVSDVRCSHASAVGPLDEELIFALEAKGVDPARAERLLADAFFADMPGLIDEERSVVRRALEERWQS